MAAKLIEVFQNRNFYYIYKLVYSIDKWQNYSDWI